MLRSSFYMMHKTNRTALYALNFRCFCWYCCCSCYFISFSGKSHVCLVVFFILFSRNSTISCCCYTWVYCTICILSRHWRNCHKSYLFFELGTFILLCCINKVYSFFSSYSLVCKYIRFQKKMKYLHLFFIYDVNFMEFCADLIQHLL